MLDAGVQTTIGTFTTDANGDYSFTAASPALFDTHTYTATLVGASPAVAISGSIETIPVAYPITGTPAGHGTAKTGTVKTGTAKTGTVKTAPTKPKQIAAR
jgi:hypothetical protein